MKYKVAICDDSDADRRYIMDMVRSWASAAGHEVQIDGFPSAESFLFRYAGESDYDILLLDIEMGTMDGVSLAKRIRLENEQVQIVFITGFPDFMAEGYEVSALHYLMKPVAKERLFAVLDKAVGNLHRNEKQFAISFDRQTVLLPLGRITYIEAQRQYVAVHTDDREYRMKASMADAEKGLDEYFFRCQRSFIVNLRQVQRIGSSSVVLKNGTEIPISRGMAQKIGKEIIRLF